MCLSEKGNKGYFLIAGATKEVVRTDDGTIIDGDGFDARGIIDTHFDGIGNGCFPVGTSELEELLIAIGIAIVGASVILLHATGFGECSSNGNGV